MHVVGVGDRLPALGPVGAQAVEPPARMVVARQRIGERRRDDRLALASEAAQDGVDEAGARRRPAARRGDGLVDQRVLGVGRIARRPEQRQRDEQERVDLGRRRFRREPAPHDLGGAEPAQRVEGERLRARARLGGQRASASLSDWPLRTAPTASAA